jgi:hypothetical protein
MSNSTGPSASAPEVSAFSPTVVLTTCAEDAIYDTIGGCLSADLCVVVAAFAAPDAQEIGRHLKDLAEEAVCVADVLHDINEAILSNQKLEVSDFYEEEVMRKDVDSLRASGVDPELCFCDKSSNVEAWKYRKCLRHGAERLRSTAHFAREAAADRAADIEMSRRIFLGDARSFHDSLARHQEMLSSHRKATGADFKMVAFVDRRRIAFVYSVVDRIAAFEFSRKLASDSRKRIRDERGASFAEMLDTRFAKRVRRNDGSSSSVSSDSDSGSDPASGSGSDLNSVTSSGEIAAEQVAFDADL